MSVECSRVVELSLLESLHYRSSGLVRLIRVFALQFLTYPLHFYFYYIGPLCSAMLISLCVGSEVCLSGMTKRCTYTLCKRAWDNSHVGTIGRPRHLDSSMTVLFLMRFRLRNSVRVVFLVCGQATVKIRAHTPACGRAGARARVHTHIHNPIPPPPHTHTYTTLSQPPPPPHTHTHTHTQPYPPPPPHTHLSF